MRREISLPETVRFGYRAVSRVQPSNARKQQRMWRFWSLVGSGWQRQTRECTAPSLLVLSILGVVNWQDNDNHEAVLAVISHAEVWIGHISDFAGSCIFWVS